MADIASNFDQQNILIDCQGTATRLAALKARTERRCLPSGPRNRGVEAQGLNGVGWSPRGGRATREDRQEAVCVRRKYRFSVTVTVNIANLRPEDISVEMVIARQIVSRQSVSIVTRSGSKACRTDNNLVTYTLDYAQQRPERSTWRCAHLPSNPHLPHIA